MAGAGGVQNYKGVMLCNRPQDDAPPELNPTMDAPRFRPGGLPAETLGLNPAKENLVSNMQAVQAEAARRRAEDPERLAPETFLTKHRRWLSDMAKKKQALNQELQESAEAAAGKRAKFEAYSKALRTAVRERASQMDAQGIPHANPKMPSDEKAAPPSPTPAPAPVPAPARGPTPPSSSGGKKKKAPAKPKWAMTEGEADDFEDAEADALVNFASGLDYDKYMDDLEVREALSVIRERIDGQKAVEAAAAAAAEAEAEADDALGEALEAAGDDWRTKFLQSWNADDDADERGSVTSTSTTRRQRAAAKEGAAEGGQPDWDSSTNAGDGKRAGPSSGALEAAAELMQSNPRLASKHSLKSLASAVGSAMGKPAEEKLPPLRLVTIVENPRVATDGSVDPSNLPYLHRNPAV